MYFHGLKDPIHGRAWNIDNVLLYSNEEEENLILFN